MLCQGYRDLGMIDDAAEWQHMCAGCSDARLGEWRWDTDRDARASGADGALPLVATDDDVADDDATTDALIAELPSPPRAITEVPAEGCGGGAAPAAAGAGVGADGEHAAAAARAAAAAAAPARAAVDGRPLPDARRGAQGAR